MATPVQMPKQGNSVEECLITEWNVKEGDTVAAGAILCTIETDKATFEVESPAAGTVLKLFRPAGELVPVLTNIAAIGNAGEDVSSLAPDGAAPAAATPAAQPAAAAPAAQAAPVTASAAAPATSGAPVSPRAKAEAARLGVNAAAVAGSGPNGRIISEDIAAAAASGMRMTPTASAAAGATGMVAGAGTGAGGMVRAGDLVAAGAAPCMCGAPCGADDATPMVMSEEVPYRGIRKLIGDRMAASLANHAQLTLNASADASAFLAYRNLVKDGAEKLGLPNITLGDMIAFVVAKTLPRFPELNGLFDKSSPVFTKRRDVQLAIAVDTERGLMVPVVRNAHLLTLAQMSAEVADLAKQCRGGKIDPERLSGGTFTISNLGAMGVESFTPVLNSPQVAILGVCAVTQRAQPDGKGGVKFVPMMGLSLTIDHQVVDGGPAARFLQALATGIANFNLVLAS